MLPDLFLSSTMLCSSEYRAELPVLAGSCTQSPRKSLPGLGPMKPSLSEYGPLPVLYMPPGHAAYVVSELHFVSDLGRGPVGLRH